MKVTNNRTRSATVFYKVQGKMKKVKLLPFESLNINEVTDINAVKNNMVISNFVASDRAAYLATLSANTAATVVTSYTFNDGLSVAASQRVARQTKGRFEVKYR